MTMDKKNRRIFSGMILRYMLALLLPINSLFLFYYIFRPLTFFPVIFILKLIYPVKTFGITRIFIEGEGIALVNSCVAGSAYYLFSALNLSTFGISWIKRIKIFIVNSAVFLLLNIFRIIILAIILIDFSDIFDAAHFLFWTFLSTAFVAFIWIATIKVYRIRHIPIISDILYLKKFIKMN